MSRRKTAASEAPADEPFGTGPSLTLTEINVWKKHYANRPAAEAPVPRSAAARAASAARARDEAREATGEASGTTSRFRRYTLDDLKRREPPKWIIDQTIAESNGGTIVYGAPGTFKTFIALDMALCIATDTAWHGRSVMQGGRVLYCVGEGSFDTDKRIEACLLHRGLTLPAGRFEVIEPAPLLRLAKDTDDFIAEAERGGSSWDVVVIDTIGRVMPGINDNAQDGARMFSEFVGRIREELGATVLALTHAPKNDGKAMLGSGVYEADADLVFNAECPNEADKGIRINFRNTKNKYGEKWDRDIGFERVKLAGSSSRSMPPLPRACVGRACRSAHARPSPS